jgi:bidirectional [NiFe] hydrogenase diaphorase subunit
MITLMIDGQEVQAAEGATVLEAALQAGVHTPTLCHHDRLHCGSNCRACVVELEGARTLIPSCSRPVQPGMAVRTDSDRVQLARRMVFELLMTESDTSAAPELQAYARYYGSDPGRYPGSPGFVTKQREPVRDNPFFIRDYAKCIACQRCVMACGEDIQHTFAIAMVGHGHAVTVGAGDGADDLTKSPCVFCGNCVGVCPTGALMGLAEYEARQEGLLETPALTWSPSEGFREGVRML